LLVVLLLLPMANRLILVPEELYKGLIKSGAEPSSSSSAILKTSGPRITRKEIKHQQEDLRNDDLATGLQFSKAKMDASKKRISTPITKGKNKLSKGKNLLASKLSANRNLYDQELRRYLKLRSLYKNKPIRVEVVGGGPHIVMKPQEGNDKKVSAAIQTGEDDEIEEEQTLDWDNTDFDEGNANRSHGTTSDGLDATFSTPPLAPFSQKLRADRSARQRVIQAAIDKAKQEFKEYIMANREKFHVTADGLHVINKASGAPMKQSNVDAIIDRLVNPTMDNMPSPTGASIIGNEAFKDPFLKSLMLTRFGRYKDPTETPRNYRDFLKGGNRSGGSRSRASQSGSGGGGRRVIAKSSIKKGASRCSRGASHYFRPSIWQQQQQQRHRKK
jgi:hypothetical protein